MKPIEAFLATEFGQKLTPEQRPIAEKVFDGMSMIHNDTVDSCIDLVRKWGQVKQLENTDDFKLLIEFLGKLKD